ncbi:MAG: ribosome recycling factor [Candidatus Lambdaproteobacteria bacterium]|nr:ribosome recycling factor [Candidatus Lambdaproteobacteria bacterium]
MLADIKTEAHNKMEHTVATVKQELAAVRTGRASADILHHVQVEYYGTHTPLQQLASFSVPDPQMIVVTAYDRGAVKEIEKAILKSDLGINPNTEGNVIRLPVPPLTEERRKELAKHVKRLGEDGKIAVRNIRRDANEKLKKLEKAKEISQDDEKKAHDSVQLETDKHIKTIDDLIRQKEGELMKV